MINRVREIFSRVLLPILKVVFRVSRILLRICGVILSLPFLIFILFTCYYNITNDHLSSKRFNTKLWKSAYQAIKEYSKGATYYLRCNMYRDLIKNHLKLGMSYDEVIKLLGDPEIYQYYFSSNVKHLVYALGECKSCFGKGTAGGITALRGPIYLRVYFNKKRELISINNDYISSDMPSDESLGKPTTFEYDSNGQCKEGIVYDDSIGEDRIVSCNLLPW